MRYVPLFCIVCIPSFSFAATASFLVREVPVAQETPLSVTLFLAEDQVPLNAIEGVISYDETKLTFTRGSAQSSIIRFWVERPHVCQEGLVCFSGITPGGFSGTQNEIVTLEFVPREEGTTTIAVQALRVLAHDGKGTDVAVNSPAVEVEVSALERTGGAALPEDIEPPEVFTPSVTQDPAVFDGDWIVVFDTTDKQTEVSGYFVKEVSALWLAPFIPWVIAESPYRLKDQSRTKHILIKAVDDSGNERIVTLQSQTPSYTVSIICAIVVLFGLCLLLYLIRRQMYQEEHRLSDS
jgi:hypothetical protein